MALPETLRRPAEVQLNVEAHVSCQLDTYVVLKEVPIALESAEQASARGKRESQWAIDGKRDYLYLKDIQL
jgi:hypothetical protein